ncbi:MAG: glycosyltransferase [Planctomycetota bacterium]
MLNGPHVLLAGGSLLGNLYPGLSIARHVQRMMPEAQVSFAGDGRAVERHLVRGAGYNYVAMPSKPVPNSPLEAVRFVTDNFVGFWASRWLVREQKVSLVVGLGGCASAAMVRAAHGKGVPFVLLEQDAAPSRTARRMAHAAEAVCGAFESLRPHLSVDAPLMVTGVPGRPGFEALADRRRRPLDAGDPLRRLVVLGGVGGGHTLNEAAPAALSEMVGDLSGWQIVHQTGEGQLQATEQRYAGRGLDALVVTHIDELASLLAETDLVVCRSGGTMLAELALAGAPAVLVPLIDGEGDHQMANARLFAEQSGCPVVDPYSTPQSLASGLAQELRLLMADAGRRQELSDRVAQLARPDAGEKIAEVVCECLCGVGGRLAA